MQRSAETRSDGTAGALLIGLIVLAASVRLGWSLTRPSDDASLQSLPDQVEYLSLARSVRAGEGLRFFDARFRDFAYAYRPAGYPLLLAALGGEVRLVRAAQALLDAASVLAAFLLARRWLGPRAALLPAALVALSPYFIFFSALVLTETLFTSMLAWSMVLLTLDRNRPRRAAVGWWLGVMVLALSAHVRPSAVALPVLLGVVATLALPLPLVAPRKLRLHAGAAALLVTVLVLLPWAWRNHVVLGRWVWTSTNAGITLYDGLHPDATGASDQSFVQRMPELRTMNELDRDRYLRGLALESAKRDPARVVRLAGVKLARMWSPVPLSDEYRGKRPYFLAGVAFAGPLFVLALLGLLRGRMTVGAKALLLAPALYLSVVHLSSVGSLRYRVPADLPLTVLAGAGATALLPRRAGSELTRDTR